MSPYKIILEELKKENEPIANIYRHLVSIFLEEEFNDNFFMLMDYHTSKNHNFDQIFYSYHKQFRQTDMYSLESARWIGKRDYEKNKDKWDDIADKLSSAHITGYHLFSSIGGELDMIFWNTIHLDDKHVWDNVLKIAYEKYNEFKDDEKTNENE